MQGSLFICEGGLIQERLHLQSKLRDHFGYLIDNGWYVFECEPGQTRLSWDGIMAAMVKFRVELSRLLTDPTANVSSTLS